jgi:hypothetical protein
MTDARDEALIRIDAAVSRWEKIEMRGVQGDVVTASYRLAAFEIREALNEVGFGRGSSIGGDDDDDE